MAYVLVGIALWIAVTASGVHPTLAGVLVGLLVPAALVETEQSTGSGSSAGP